MNDIKKIVIISDGTGRTAKRLMDAVLSQYARKNIEYTLVNTYQEVRRTEQCDEILKQIDDKFLIVFSIISKDLAQYLHERLSERNILHLNVLRPVVETMTKFLGMHPDFEPGILQKIDDRYYKKIDAIGYTVEHDDGRGMLIEEADIVILGPSRTCKTPICMYLACNHGIRAANIPVFPTASIEEYILSRLKPIDKKNIFCLTMHPDVLAQVRQERSYQLTHSIDDHAELQEYSDVQKIREELRFCRHLFTMGDWHVIDVTRRAIEEISVEILDIVDNNNQ
ncbi:MAG: pyruvate, phosphate dikinase/phosphoenolpyruvate synthase regulator [candidate division Zixibacteria bacterium]|nr:pyruvate, phosphate dikinase/phosphoenolpyruvate synthase regulator [candidate division Zixibacteria bacterium]